MLISRERVLWLNGDNGESPSSSSSKRTYVRTYAYVCTYIYDTRRVGCHGRFSAESLKAKAGTLSPPPLSSSSSFFPLEEPQATFGSPRSRRSRGRDPRFANFLWTTAFDKARTRQFRRQSREDAKISREENSRDFFLSLSFSRRRN